MENMKKCRYCKSDIDKKAKICPNCRKNQTSSGVKVLIGFISFSIFCAIIVNTFGDISTTTNKEVKQAIIGETVEISGVEYIVDEFELEKELKAGGGFLKVTADGKYLLIKLTVTNNSQSAININSSNFKLRDENGATYAASILVSIDDYDMFNYETINPNGTEVGYMAYDISAEDLEYTLVIDGAKWMDSAGIEITLK